MDLLLHLISTHEMDILDVPLAPLVDEFVAVLRDDSLDMPVEQLSEFLLVASILLEMKSQRLLPGRDSTEPDEEFVGWEERDVLLARLLELRTYAALSDAFVSLFERASQSFPRLRGIDDGFEVTPPDLLAGVTPALLAGAYLRGIEEKPVLVVRLNHMTVDAVTVAETVVALSQRLPAMGRLTFRALTDGLDRQHPLANQDLALEHPIERSAVQDFIGALGRLAGRNHRRMAKRRPLRAPGAQLLRRINTHTELDQMERQEARVVVLSPEPRRVCVEPIRPPCLHAPLG